jgi:hypothetical protein
MTDHDPDVLDAVIFPGGAPSRRARAERGAPPPETPADSEPAWDDHPQTKELHGEMMELFSIGALAGGLQVGAAATVPAGPLPHAAAGEVEHPRQVGGRPPDVHPSPD